MVYFLGFRLPLSQSEIGGHKATSLRLKDKLTCPSHSARSAWTGSIAVARRQGI